MKSIVLIETYTCGTSKDLISEKEEIKSNNRTKQDKYDYIWCYKRNHKRT